MILFRRINAALPHSCAVTATHLQQVLWIWGTAAFLEDDIDNGDAEPIRQPPRRPPLSARQAKEDILNEMLQTGVIEPSNSPWSSPVCMVRKKDGSYRYCVDYRRMNSVTIKDAFPVPDVKDALNSLRGAKYYTHGQLQKIPVGAPMDLVTIDILSGLSTADDGSKDLLVVVDAFTKWVEAYPLPDQEAATCITAVYKGMFSRFGLLRQLHSDQGRNFESQLVTELCNITAVYKTRTTA